MQTYKELKGRTCRSRITYIQLVRYHFRHTALLWTKPRTEEDVTNLAMKWKKTLITHGCESFFDRGGMCIKLDQ